jgi:hypothetical protein
MVTVHKDANHPDGIWYGKVIKSIRRAADHALRFHVVYTEDGGEVAMESRPGCWLQLLLIMSDCCC